MSEAVAEFVEVTTDQELEGVEAEASAPQVESPPRLSQDQRWYSQNKLMEIVSHFNVDARHEVRHRFVEIMNGVDAAASQTADGAKLAGFQKRAQETRERLTAMQDEHQQATLRHHSALSGTDDVELEAARKAVLSSGLEIDITKDELRVLNQLEAEADASVKRSHAALHRQARLDLIASTEQAIDEVTSALWEKLREPALQAMFKKLITETGLRAICSQNYDNFKINATDYILTGHIHR